MKINIDEAVAEDVPRLLALLVSEVQGLRAELLRSAQRADKVRAAAGGVNVKSGRRGAK